MTRPPWSDPPAYPTERYQLPDSYRFEVHPLFGDRGRIVATDGIVVSDFW